MPTYDYKCSACGHRFELFQSMRHRPKRKCPECGRNALERLIGTGAAVLFKGSGFYQTDYRSESYKKAAAAESGNGSDSSKGKSSTTTDGKSSPAEGKHPKKAKASPIAENSG